MPRVQDALPSLDCRAWKGRSNPLLLSALRFAPESRLGAKGPATRRQGPAGQVEDRDFPRRLAQRPHRCAPPEPLEFITVHFQLVSNSNPPAIRAALDDLAPLRKEGDAFWNWVEEKALHRKFAKGQAANTRTFGTTMDDGAIVLGAVELTANALKLSVNSEPRAARGRTLLA